MRSPAKIIPLLIALLVLVLIINHCYCTPEAQVKRALRAAIKAAEKDDVAGISNFIADDYRDQFGADKATWVMLIGLALQQWKDINIKIVQLKIKIIGDQATTTFAVIGEATSAASLGPGKIPDRQTYQRANVTLQLARQQDRWVLVNFGDLNAQEWTSPAAGLLEGMP